MHTSVAPPAQDSSPIEHVVGSSDREIEREQPVPLFKVPVEGDKVELMVGLENAEEETNAAEAKLVPVELVGVAAEHPAVIADGATAPAAADTVTNTLKTDTDGSLEGGQVVEPGEVQPTAGDASNARPETESERPVLPMQAVVEGFERMPAVHPDTAAVGVANDSDVLTASDSAGVELAQPAVEVEQRSVIKADTAESLESTKTVDRDSVHTATSDSTVDAGQETEPERPVPSADTVVGDGMAVTAVADSDDPGEVSADQAIPTSTESTRESAVIGAATEVDNGDTAPAEAGTTMSVANVDPTTSLESGKVVELVEAQPPSADVDRLVEVEPAAAILTDPSADTTAVMVRVPELIVTVGFVFSILRPSRPRLDPFWELTAKTANN